MYKLFVIAYREYVAMVGTKAFLFSLILMPILMFGGVLLIPSLQKVSGSRTLKIVVADGTESLFEELQQAANTYNETLKGQLSQGTTDSFGSNDFFEIERAETSVLTDEQKLKLSDSIRLGAIYAFLEIPPGLLEKPKLDEEPSAASKSLPTMYCFDALMSPAKRWVSGWLSLKVRALRIQQFGLDTVDPKVLQLVQSGVEVVGNRPIEKAVETKVQSTTDALKAMFLPFGVMTLMFLVILMAAQPMLESAMEEKSLRISEVLIGSVTPTQLMGGKLLGNVAGSLVIFILYGCGGLFVLSKQDMLSSLPVSLLPWFIVFQLLGVLFFSSIFLVVGSSVSELKEAQTLLLPVWMMLMLPMMVWFVAVRDPNGVVATALSFFPPSCPMTMVLRLSSGTSVPWWQPFTAAGVMLIATSSLVVLAGRIYRIGLLRTDGVRSMFQLLKRASQLT